MVDLRERKGMLEARLAELTKRLAGIETQLDTRLETDPLDTAIEHENDEVLEDLGQAGLDEITAIKAALARLDAGEYGICQSCGERIGDARLDILPFTPFCAACARALDNTHG